MPVNSIQVAQPDSKLVRLHGLFSQTCEKLKRLHQLDNRFADHPSEEVQRELLINRGVITACNQKLTRLSRLIVAEKAAEDGAEPSLKPSV